MRSGVVSWSQDGGAQSRSCGREWGGVKPEGVGRGRERGEGDEVTAAMASDGGRKQFWKRSGAKVPGR